MIINTINVIALSTLFVTTTALAANKQTAKNQAPSSNVQWSLSCGNQSIVLGMAPDEVAKKCGKPNKTRSSKDKKRTYFTYRPNSNQNMNAKKARKMKDANNSAASQVKLKFIDNKLLNINYESGSKIK